MEPTKPTATSPASPAAARRARSTAASADARIRRASSRQHPAGRGELDPAAVAQQQLGADLGLERLDLLTQRRLRDVQALRRAAEVQLFGDGDEVSEVAQLHD